MYTYTRIPSNWEIDFECSVTRIAHTLADHVNAEVAQYGNQKSKVHSCDSPINSKPS